MAWIDYQKAYDMVPQPWIKKSMGLCRIANSISHILSISIESWQAIIMSGNHKLGRVNIALIPLSHTIQKVNARCQLGKTQHKKIYELLFMDNLKLYGNIEKKSERLTNTVKTFPKDHSMGFGISKCTHVTMRAGKIVSVGRIEPSSGEVILELESDKGSKCLRILETNDIMHSEIKNKIQKEYYKKLRELTSSKLNGRNTTRSINSRSVASVRYSAGILK